MGTNATEKRAMPAALPPVSISGINLRIKALPLGFFEIPKTQKRGWSPFLTEIGLHKFEKCRPILFILNLSPISKNLSRHLGLHIKNNTTTLNLASCHFSLLAPSSLALQVSILSNQNTLWDYINLVESKNLELLATASTSNAYGRIH